MALTPYQTDALIREVDDAVRQDDMMSFWRRYGRMVAAAVGIGLAAFGGWLLWQNHTTSVAEANSEQFASLLKSAQGGSIDEAVLKKLDGAGAGYKTEAQLVKAALAAGRDKLPEANATYDAVLADSATPQPMKDAALIRKTALNFDRMKPEQVIAALKDLAVPGNPWFGSAGEMTAIAYLNSGKRQQAGELFSNISRDTNVPDTIRMRAGQMAATLGLHTAPQPDTAGATPQ